jgi:hypothetical protein
MARASRSKAPRDYHHRGGDYEFLLLIAVVCSRLHELQDALSAGMIAQEISSRNSASRRSSSSRSD